MNERMIVFYPSGANLEIFGRFETHGPLSEEKGSPYGVAVTVLESVVLGGVQVSPGGVAVLDPRCVIIGESSGVIYTPRPFWHQFPPGLKSWMRDHPNWPPRDNSLTLEGESTND